MGKKKKNKEPVESMEDLIKVELTFTVQMVVFGSNKKDYLKNKNNKILQLNESCRNISLVDEYVIQGELED